MLADELFLLLEGVILLVLSTVADAPIAVNNSSRAPNGGLVLPPDITTNSVMNSRRLSGCHLSFLLRLLT